MHYKKGIFSPLANHGVGKEKLPSQKMVSPKYLWIQPWNILPSAALVKQQACVVSQSKKNKSSWNR